LFAGRCFIARTVGLNLTLFRLLAMHDRRLADP